MAKKARIYYTRDRFNKTILNPYAIFSAKPKFYEGRYFTPSGEAQTSSHPILGIKLEPGQMVVFEAVEPKKKGGK